LKKFYTLLKGPCRIVLISLESEVQMALHASLLNNQSECVTALLQFFPLDTHLLPLPVMPFPSSILGKTLEHLIFTIIGSCESPLHFINVNNERGFTPLHYAAIFNLPNSLKALVETGACMTTIDEYERTPLHWACLLGHDMCVEILLDSGILQKLPHLLDLGRLSPLTLALSKKQTKVVDLLAKHGCVYGPHCAKDTSLMEAYFWPRNDVPIVINYPGVVQCECPTVVCSVGCQAQIPSCLQDDHLQVCQAPSRYCPNCGAGPLTGPQLCTHLECDCQYMKCHQCRASLTRTEFNVHLSQHQRPAWETCVLCQAMVDRDNDWGHYAQCPSHVIICPACHLSYTRSTVHSCPYPSVPIPVHRPLGLLHAININCIY